MELNPKFPQNAKKFWQQEAQFEPPVARTRCATKLFHRKNIKVRNRIVLTVSDFCGTAKGTRTPDLLIRSQSLYPTELSPHTSALTALENYSMGF